MNYSDLKLKKNNEIKEIEWDGNIIKVSQYLPIINKLDIITLAVQEGFSQDVYISNAVQAISQVFTVMYYTDLEFTQEEKNNPFILYDEMKSNGLLDEIFKAIPSEELEDIYEGLFTFQRAKEETRLSLSATIRELLETLPDKFEEIGKLVENFDPEQYENVLNFAKANGMR